MLFLYVMFILMFFGCHLAIEVKRDYQEEYAKCMLVLRMEEDERAVAAFQRKTYADTYLLNTTLANEQRHSRELTRIFVTSSDNAVRVIRTRIAVERHNERMNYVTRLYNLALAEEASWQA